MNYLNDKATGYIWFNPITGMYQKGKAEEFKRSAEQSGRKEDFSLILKLTNESDILAYKIVKQLNIARAEEEASDKVAV